MIRVMIRTGTNSPRSYVLVQTSLLQAVRVSRKICRWVEKNGLLHEKAPGQPSDGVNPSKASTDIAQGSNLSHGLCMTVTSVNLWSRRVESPRTVRRSIPGRCELVRRWWTMPFRGFSFLFSLLTSEVC